MMTRDYLNPLDRSVLVVCTRNRPGEMNSLLRCLEQCSHLPASVLIADASSDLRTMRVVNNHAESLPAELSYVRCSPGLARQRNQALALLSPTKLEYVFFLDDDVVVPRDYFVSLVEVFAQHPEADGLAPALAHAPIQRRTRFHRLFGLDGEDGSVLASGRNVRCPKPESPLFEVQWMSGLAMAFPADVLDGRTFDGRLVGYSVGEDLDFTYRLHRDGHRLFISSRVMVSHSESEVNRESARQLAWLRTVTYPIWLRENGLSTTRFWMSVLGECLLWLGRALRGKGGYGAMLGLASASIDVLLTRGGSRSADAAWATRPLTDRLRLLRQSRSACQV